MRTKKTEEITKRYLELVHELIKKERLKGGKIVNMKVFSESVNYPPQNFSKFHTSDQHVTLSLVELSCRKFGFSPTYLILGTGNKHLNNSDSLEQRVTDLEKKVKRLESKI